MGTQAQFYAYNMTIESSSPDLAMPPFGKGLLDVNLYTMFLQKISFQNLREKKVNCCWIIIMLDSEFLTWLFELFL